MKKAFTLIEILVAMGLVMILTGAGIGTLRQSARRKAVENAASDVVAVLHQAQAYAASGQKINCTAAQPLAGWQVNFTATGYELQELCPQSAGSPFLIKSGTWPDNISPSSLPSANPILFRVLGQGTNVAGQTGVEISGFGITQGVGVNSAGEVSLGYPPPTPTLTPTPTPTATPISCSAMGAACTKDSQCCSNKCKDKKCR